MKGKIMVKRTEPCSTVHPPSSEMMSNAILILEDQAGSIRPAVSEFIGKSLPSAKDRSISIRVKKRAESERLMQVKSSYKAAASLTDNPGILEKEAPTDQRATRKTRRLSQVETPEALRKATRKRKAMPSEIGDCNRGKIKRLSEVKTPKGFKKADKKKKTKKTATPVKRKSLKRPGASKPVKKGRK